jgi:UDP-2,3-diacylglucosamine hydrolase
MININLNSSKKIYFSSDNHLGAPVQKVSFERELRFISWLDLIKKDAQTIFLLGDLFDFWFEYKHVVPKGYTRLFGKLAELSDSGIEIFFFIGNHDCWVKDYFEKELNIKVLKKPTKFQIDNNKLFVGHGDGLGPGDYKYKFLKLIFRNVITKKLFSFLHPDIAISLGNYLSRKNKIISGNDKKFSNKENELLYHFCKEKLNEEYFNYFIFGHRHCPLEIDLGNNSKYLNTGDWISFYSYIEYDGTSFSLKYFKD